MRANIETVVCDTGIQGTTLWQALVRNEEPTLVEISNAGSIVVYIAAGTFDRLSLNFRGGCEYFRPKL